MALNTRHTCVKTPRPTHWGFRFFIGSALISSLCATLPQAHASSATIDYFSSRSHRTAIPTLLSQDDRNYYADLFAAIESKNWTKVQSMFAEREDGPLHAVAQAEYYLASGSPRIELETLNTWLNKTTSLPKSEQIGRLATVRGATQLPSMPRQNTLQKLPTVTHRTLPRETRDGTMPTSTAASIRDRIKNDDPIGARHLLSSMEESLSPEARTEWRQRVAWSFYIENDDTNALTTALEAAQGTGAWLGEAWWTAGLAAFRLGDCMSAINSFSQAASTASNEELVTAAQYWQSRALVRCRKPDLASAPLKAAAARDETFYGMLASEQLGKKLPEQHRQPDFTQHDWQELRNLPNIRTAVQLAEIGQENLADEVLRHQVRIGLASQYQPLTRLARDLGLPSTQLWMAYNTPVGGRPEPATRFPTPKWTPVGGWKVNPALIYAHTLQESRFRTSVVSPAGARGLMQIMPRTARDRARDLGLPSATPNLNTPAINLAFGQRHLEMLREHPTTQGLLPKVIAAYNAGHAPLARWNTEIRDQGDPLLWIESIPYWETRGYVNIVLRNYWMYERQASDSSESRSALAQAAWPTFPDLSGSRAVRMAVNGTLLNR